MDLSLAVAQGFHNAPRLYGDDTVRTAPRISGIQSGLRAADSEFTLGIYDGVTGLFLQPYNGARQHGAAGFVKGVGKGVGGFVLKDLAAIIGPFGYTMTGIHKEIVKTRQPTAFIRRARIIKGLQDVQALDEGLRGKVREKVGAAWRIVCEIRREEETWRREGVKGRVAVLRERRRVEERGGFENVGEARRALRRRQEERRVRERESLMRGEDRRASLLLGKRSRGRKGRMDAGEGRAGGSRAGSVSGDGATDLVDYGSGGQVDGDVNGVVNGRVDVDGNGKGIATVGADLGSGIENGAAMAAA